MESRRKFLKNLFFLSSSTAISRPLVQEKKQTRRFQKGKMYYRRLGRTNIHISEISLGGSPLPDESLLYEAIERGVNYIDTSSTYMNGNGERLIGKLLKKTGREKIHVGTKFHLRGENWNDESIIKEVNSSLQRLDTDYVDVLLIHGAKDVESLTDDRVLNAYEILKKEGKYRYRGLSCHTNHHQIVKKAVECNEYDVIMLGYNVFDIQEPKNNTEVFDDYLEQSGIRHLISLARSNDVGVIAMKTLKTGGKKQNLEKYRTNTTSIFQAMLKWCLEDKNISSVITEMLTHEQLEEDLGVVGLPLSQDERISLYRHVVKNSGNICHMCGFCETACPSGIKTATILRYFAYQEIQGKTLYAKKLFSNLTPAQRASSCQNCGKCEKACPYGISIREKIRLAENTLGS